MPRQARMWKALPVVLALLLVALPAAAERPSLPIHVHGGAAWAPAMDLALDEVHLVWTGEPRRAATPTAG